MKRADVEGTFGCAQQKQVYCMHALLFQKLLENSWGCLNVNITLAPRQKIIFQSRAEVFSDILEDIELMCLLDTHS